MNPAARIHRTEQARIDLSRVLDQGGFNLDRALAVDPKFLEPEYPFEWGGVFVLPEGPLTLQVGAGPDPSMRLVLMRVRAAGALGLEEVLMPAVLTFSDEPQPRAPGDSVAPGATLHELQLAGPGRFTVDVPVAGRYALFTQHRPEEFDLALAATDGPLAPEHQRDFKPDHEHDDEVTSVGITTAGDLDSKKLNQWLQDILMRQGPDIYRMKGVLSIRGEDRRFVFQGVHMLFDGRPDRPWNGEPRHNSLIFIGRNLDRERLTRGFEACLV
jgi:G3E family GTPase